MWSHSEMLLHEAAPPHTPCKAFCPSFLGNMVQVCCYTLHPFPTCFLTMFIMPSYCSPLSKVMLIHLHSVLLLSPLCYGFGFIPTTYKPQQTELFMLATTINFPSGNVGFKKTNIIISSKVKFLLYIYFYLLQKKKNKNSQLCQTLARTQFICLYITSPSRPLFQ